MHELDHVYHPLELQRKKVQTGKHMGEKGKCGLEKSHAHILKIKMVK